MRANNGYDISLEYNFKHPEFPDGSYIEFGFDGTARDGYSVERARVITTDGTKIEVSLARAEAWASVNGYELDERANLQAYNAKFDPE
jgi:hypothetical protein